MTLAPYIAKPVRSARDAIASHVRWKITLLVAAEMREPLSERAANSIRHPDECSIRKWLLSPDTLALRAMPEYNAALANHLAFHDEMRHINELLNAGRYDEVRPLINQPGPFQSASMAFANAVMAMDRIGRSRPSATELLRK